MRAMSQILMIIIRHWIHESARFTLILVVARKPVQRPSNKTLSNPPCKELLVPPEVADNKHEAVRTVLSSLEAN